MIKLLVDTSWGEPEFSVLCRNPEGVVTTSLVGWNMDLDRPYTLEELMGFLSSKGYSFDLTDREVKTFYKGVIHRFMHMLASDYADWEDLMAEREAKGLDTTNAVFQPTTKRPELWTVEEYKNYFEEEE